MKYYYAVAIGKNPGIYTNWSECEIQIKNISKAKYKKFTNKEEANQFLEMFREKEKSEIISKIKEKEEIILEHDYYVYTDGSCSNNGKSNARCSIGVYFGKDDSRNVSKELLDIEKKTNNVAELSAMLEAFNIIFKDITENNKKICIFTDSNYTILCLTTYGKKCEINDWKKDIPNLELVKKLYTTYHSIFPPNSIQIKHILAHTGKEDIHSLGNEMADFLANKAISFV